MVREQPRPPAQMRPHQKSGFHFKPFADRFFKYDTNTQQFMFKRRTNFTSLQPKYHPIYCMQITNYYTKNNI